MTRRSERLGEEIREEIALIVGRGLKDPRIGFVTITRVSLSGDLRVARVYVGVLGESDQRSETMAGLKSAAGYVRRELGRRVRLRHTPELLFHYDAGLDATERVAQLLDEQPPSPPPADEDDED